VGRHGILVGMAWSEPLDGIHDVPWDELRNGRSTGRTSAEIVPLLVQLADRAAAPGAVRAVSARIEQVIGHCGMYGQVAPPTARFLARIAASHPSVEASRLALDLVEEIAYGMTDAPDMAGAPDDYVDALRVELRASVDALREAARVLPASPAHMASVLADRIVAGVVPGGAYEPRWRGVAHEFVRAPADRVHVVVHEGRHLVMTNDFNGRLGFWDATTGEPAGLAVEAGRPRHAVAFVDTDGLGVIAVDWSGPVQLWRPDGAVLRSRRLGSEPRRRPWWQRRTIPAPFRSETVAFASYDNVVVVGDEHGRIARHDSRTGAEIGPALQHPCGVESLCTYVVGGVRHLAVSDAIGAVHRYEIESGRALGTFAGFGGIAAEPGIRVVTRVNVVPYMHVGRVCVAITGTRRSLGRFDAATGAEIGSPIEFAGSTCAGTYELDGRVVIAVGAYRQIHRIDAATGSPIGPMLDGQREDISDITVATIGCRPTIFTADGWTVCRWDAQTGTPWPAALPRSRSLTGDDNE
jgi:hypothetical protein